MHGAPARDREQEARGPHLGFRKDYNKVPLVKFVADRDQVGGVRPFRGVDGLRPEQQKMWEMKQPQKPGGWQGKYPKSHEQKGPAGQIQQGKMRIGADKVGPVLEMKLRRVDLRPHARGHDEIDVHRVGVFPTWPQPPPNEDDFIFDPDRPKPVPADPEDRSRAEHGLNSRRSMAVRRLFTALDPHGTGKIEIRVMLSHLNQRCYRKFLDFWSRNGVLVSPDDLDEQLLGMLTSLIQKESKDVRMQTAFMPSGTGAGCRSGRLGTLTGYVRLRELQVIQTPPSLIGSGSPRTYSSTQSRRQPSCMPAAVYVNKSITCGRGDSQAT